MSYDSARSRLLIEQTRLAGATATLAELERANQLDAADTEVTLLRQGIGRIATSGVSVEARMAAQLLSSAMITAEIAPDRPNKAAS